MKGISIPSWQALIAADPEAAARSFIAHIEGYPESVRRAVFAHIPDCNSLIQAFTRCASSAEDQALSSVPFLVKDLFHVAGLPTRAGATFLEETLEPPRVSSTLYNRLIEKGAVYAGKTQLNEFAYGLSGENLHYGDCPHPHVKGLLSGGSSSGSAWSVAQGVVPLALGTDTAGSIRVPAAFCGIFGMRLEPGDWSLENVFPLAPSYDTAGWFAANLEDMDRVNRTLLPEPLPGESFKGLYLDMWDDDFVHNELRQNCAQLAGKLGLGVNEEVSRELKESFSSAASTYGIMQSREAYNIHRAWLDAMRDRYDPIVWDRIDRGRRWTETEVEHASEQQRTIRYACSHYFRDYTVLAMPVTPLPALPKELLTSGFRRQLLAFNTPVSLAGLPALTLPVPLSNNLNGGLQLIFSSIDKAPWGEVINRARAYYK